MSTDRTILLLAPTKAEQAASHAIAMELESSKCHVKELLIDGNYDEVLDALRGAIIPVVVK